MKKKWHCSLLCELFSFQHLVEKASHQDKGTEDQFTSPRIERNNISNLYLANGKNIKVEDLNGLANEKGYMKAKTKHQV